MQCWPINTNLFLQQHLMDHTIHNRYHKLHLITPHWLSECILQHFENTKIPDEFFHRKYQGIFITKYYFAFKIHILNTGDWNTTQLCSTIWPCNDDPSDSIHMTPIFHLWWLFLSLMLLLLSSQNIYPLYTIEWVKMCRLHFSLSFKRCVKKVGQSNKVLNSLQSIKLDNNIMFDNN